MITLERMLKKLISEAIKPDDTRVEKWIAQLSAMLDALNSDFKETAQDGDLSLGMIGDLDNLARLAGRVSKIAGRLRNMENR